MQRQLTEGATPFVVRERVRWSDVDAAGIVCYGSFLRFFELAEGELFRAAGLPHTVLDGEGVWLVRRRMECDFLRPARLDDELEVRATVAALGRTSVSLEFEIRGAAHDGASVLSRYTLVAVDRESLRPVPLPERVRAGLRRFGCDARHIQAPPRAAHSQ
ncbi:MAG TPA: thioesterase family protein [Longimicrobium sp.]|jgi:YbgC/YbaW family acyl-CoA thioester hydrolase